ncbi:MAG: histidine kinase [Alphaproteobacteria bacterium]|nr:histidine kinase [Alphaproteobacteria bacterium]
MRLSSLLPVLPLRAWLGFSYLAVLTFPVAAVLATGALGRDLVNQTRWDLEHQAALVAMLAGNEVEGARRVAPAATLPDLTAELSEHLRQAKAETLSGYRVVDAQGRVVATSGTGESLGDSLASDVEVRQALAGRAAVKIRPREAVRNVPLGGQSRRADVRVFVAYPIEVHGEVLGAVVVSRTPREELQALYQMAPSGLLVGAVFALLVTAMFAWFSADILSRSLRSLAIGSRRIAEGHFDGLEQLAAPKGSHLREVGEASRNVEAMAVRLRDRLAYIGEFASNVSHEFKTPLSTLKGTLELLGDDPDMDPAQRQRFLTNASESVDRLERMVTGLLSLARAEEGGSAEPIELDGLVRAVAARFDAPVEGRAGRVSGDPAQLETVLVNLLQNARVHGGAARVEAFVAEGATGFAVIDDGPGISASNLDKVFDRFFTTNRGGGSSGLGLALVRAIAFTHGGDVAVRSRPGETVFTVTLPGA